MGSILAAVRNVYDKLNLPQRFYAAAFLYLIFSLIFFDMEGQLFFVGLLGLAGLTVEFWPKFVMAWDTFLGRILIALVYLIVANLALAVGSQILNEITGIDPSPLYYSKGFATLLIAPIFVLSMTAIMMLFYLVAVQIYLIVKLLLKVLRIKQLSLNKANLAYPTRTIILKTILMPIMFVPVIKSINSYWQEFSNDPLDVIVAGELDPDTLKDPDALKNPDALQNSVSENTHNTPIVKGISFDKLIASFIYNIEAYEYSQCKKEDDQRAVFIGINEILLVRPMPDRLLGYEFTVRVCELTNEIHTIEGLNEDELIN